MKRSSRFCAILLAGLFCVQGATQAAPQASPAWEWPVSTPGDQGLDAKKLVDLTEHVRRGRGSSTTAGESFWFPPCS